MSNYYNPNRSNILNHNSDIYDKLEDDQKFKLDPDKFIEELKDDFQSGNEDEAISRAEDQGIDIDEIIE